MSRRRDTREEYLRDIESDRSWYCHITNWMAPAVANRIRRMLTGKQYTFVAVNDFFGNIPEVRTSQYLDGCVDSKGPGTVENVICKMLSDKHAHITVCDTYGVWGISSTTDDEKCRDEGKAPYIHFEHDRRGEKLTITHRSGSGNRIYWCIAVEDTTALSDALKP